MRKLLAFLFCAAMISVQCGGVDVGPADGLESAEEGGSPEIAPATKSVAQTVTPPASVGVDAGFASNGTTVDIPAGFTLDQCRFTAAAANIDGNALSTRVSINSETGEVLCEKVVQERTEVPPETKDCVASFTVICVR